MTADTMAELIEAGRAVLGIELGSTRIKAVLIAPDHTPIAIGGHSWENEFVNGLWTYSLDAVWDGLRQSYAALRDDVRGRYGVELGRLSALGISGMMHGYLAFDAAGELLTGFRTWRNSNTSVAAQTLSAALGANIPERWSVAHLYQALLDGEPHTDRVAQLTTLAGYVHWKLTGRKELGVGDASGMFPIDVGTGGYDAAMLHTFDRLARERGLSTPLANLLPTIRSAGDPAGVLTEAGALLLDPSATLAAGTPMCPPEGDAGTGMVATNSIAPGTGNVSAGTSIFVMVVLRDKLSQVHRELDLVTTPDGAAVAMVHCNNGASELDAWASVFTEVTATLGLPVNKSMVFEALMQSALDAEADGGGLIAYNFLAGEPIIDLAHGRPAVLRTAGSRLTLANFMRSQVFSALAVLRLGVDILREDANIEITRIFAHGGLFRTKVVAQRFLAAALNAAVSVGDIAEEGGAWGIAVLAAYLVQGDGRKLPDYLADEVFAGAQLTTIAPDHLDRAGFDRFLARFVAGLPIERAVADHI